MAKFEEKFNKEMQKRFDDGKTRNIFNRDKYNSVISALKNPGEKGSGKNYYYSKRYDVLAVAGIERLITKVPNDDPQNFKVFVFLEELFGVLDKAHKETGHGGRDRMLRKICEGYANISRDSIELFLTFCENCCLKKKHLSKGVVVRPISSNEFNSRGQVDLLDFQSNPDGEKRFIMVYQDHFTKFCILKALASKRASEVACQLVDIFTLIGAPHILQSDNGREFVAVVVQELKLMWPELVIVHGKPRHPQSQGSVERSNADVHDMLTAWMLDNESPRWSMGLKFVQLQKNTALNKGTGRSPYEALFGKTATVGLSSMAALPKEVLSTVEREEDLMALTSVTSSMENNQDEITHTPGESTGEETTIQHDAVANISKENNQDEITHTPGESTGEETTIQHDAVANISKSGDVPCGICSVQLVDDYNCCSKCNIPIHDDCARKVDSDDKDGKRLICANCHVAKGRERHRSGTKENQDKQAVAMVKRSKRILGTPEVGQTVAVPIPLNDRAK